MASQSNLRTYQRYGKEGRCPRCGNPRDTTAKQCQRCREYGRVVATRRRTKFAKEGCCSECGKRSPQQDKKLCSECADASNQKVKQANMRIRQEMVVAYGGVCVCCGENDWRFLTIDHIDGGGQQDRRRFGGGFYQGLKREGWPKEGLQLLCANCNSGKSWFGECPHKVISSRQDEYRLKPA